MVLSRTLIGKRDPGNTFPTRLHVLSATPEYSEYITWLPAARSSTWKIHDKARLEKKVIPCHFRTFVIRNMHPSCDRYVLFVFLRPILRDARSFLPLCLFLCKQILCWRQCCNHHFANTDNELDSAGERMGGQAF